MKRILKRTVFIVGWVVAFCLSAAAAERMDFSGPIAEVRSDVNAAAEALQAQRDRIAGERRPLAEKAEALQREVAELRRDARQRRHARERRAGEQQRIEADIAWYEAELAAVEQALSSYRRDLETRIHRAESLARADVLEEWDRRFGARIEPDRVPAAAELLWENAFDWAEERLGGFCFAGACLDEDGVRMDGWFLSAGPSVWFVDEEGVRGGLTMTRPGSMLPALAPRQPSGQAGALLEASDGGEVLLSADLTRGDALRRQEARRGWIAQANDGGVVMIPLLLLAVSAVILAVGKAVSLAHAHVDGRDVVPAVLSALREGDRERAFREADRAGEPLRDVVREGLAHSHVAPVDLEELLHERVLSAVPRLERHLGALAVLGGVAPLLGLLGTVTGMIQTFQLITLFGTGDARLLSSGISEALVTTQFGLVIAVPTLLVHAYLVRRVRDLVGRLEDSAIALAHGLRGTEPSL